MWTFKGLDRVICEPMERSLDWIFALGSDISIHLRV